MDAEGGRMKSNEEKAKAVRVLAGGQEKPTAVEKIDSGV
jgi:hypothetical protein